MTWWKGSQQAPHPSHPNSITLITRPPVNTIHWRISSPHSRPPSVCPQWIYREPQAHFVFEISAKFIKVVGRLKSGPKHLKSKHSLLTILLIPQNSFDSPLLSSSTSTERWHSTWTCQGNSFHFVRYYCPAFEKWNGFEFDSFLFQDQRTAESEWWKTSEMNRSNRSNRRRSALCPSHLSRGVVQLLSRVLTSQYNNRVSMGWGWGGWWIITTWKMVRFDPKTLIAAAAKQQRTLCGAWNKRISINGQENSQRMVYRLIIYIIQLGTHKRYSMGNSCRKMAIGTCEKFRKFWMGSLSDFCRPILQCRSRRRRRAKVTGQTQRWHWKCGN